MLAMNKPSKADGTSEQHSAGNTNVQFLHNYGKVWYITGA
jgi:hypothetical protein